MLAVAAMMVAKNGVDNFIVDVDVALTEGVVGEM